MHHMRIRHVFRVLYPGESNDSCSPDLKCKAGPDVAPPSDGNYSRLVLEHVLHGSKKKKASKSCFISTTASLGVAQRFSGQLFAPVALIYIGDTPDAAGKVQNLTNECLRKSLEENSDVAGGVNMERFQRVGIRAKRSQEVLLFATVPRECVRVLWPSTRGRPCRAWPFDAAAELGNGFEDLDKLLGEAGVRPPGAWAPPLRGREISIDGPNALRPIRAIGGANDGLSLVDIGGRRFLLKRAKPNVEDDEMLSAEAMRAQLRTCWVAHAMRAVAVAAASEDPGDDEGGDTSVAATTELQCCLYEYEAFFADFRDPENGGPFTWQDEKIAGSAQQVWSGSFLLFRWPEDGELLSPHDRSNKAAWGVVADCVLGVPAGATRALHSRSELAEELAGLSEAQQELVLHALRLDLALGCPALERKKEPDDEAALAERKQRFVRAEGFVRAETTLDLLKEAAEDVENCPRLLGDESLCAVLLKRPVRKLKRQIVAIASLLDLQSYRTEIHVKHRTTFSFCVARRLELLREVEVELHLPSSMRSESLPERSYSMASAFLRQDSQMLSLSSKGSQSSLASRSRSLPAEEQCYVSLSATIDSVLELTCNWCAILFTEPLRTWNNRTSGEGMLGQNCACSEFLSYQIASNKNLNGRFKTTVEVATYSSLVQAAENNGIVFLHTRVEVEFSRSQSVVTSVTLRVCLESDADQAESSIWTNSQWHELQLPVFVEQSRQSWSETAERSQTNHSDFLVQMQNSGLKFLFLLGSGDSDQSEGNDGGTEIRVLELGFFVILLKGPEEQLCRFSNLFCEALVDDKNPEVAFRACALACGLVSAKLFVPEDRKDRNVMSVRKGKCSSVDHTEKFLKTSTSRNNEVIADIVQRIRCPHMHRSHVFVEELFVHLDTFVIWSSDQQQGCQPEWSGNGVEVLNIFGSLGNSNVSELATELVQYCIFRPKIFPLVSKTKYVGCPNDAIFELEEGCSENDLMEQIDKDSVDQWQLIIIDARKQKSENLKNLFSFPSEFMNFAGEKNLRIILFHSQEQCEPASHSCIHFPEGLAPTEWSLEKRILPLFDSAGNRSTMNDQHDFQHILKEAVKKGFRCEHSFHRMFANCKERTKGQTTSIAILNYLLDGGVIQTPKSQVSVEVVKDRSWCDSNEIWRRFQSVRRDELGSVLDDDEGSNLLRTVIDMLAKCDVPGSSSSASIKFQILRPFALVAKNQAGLLLEWCNSLNSLAGSTGVVDLMLSKLFDLIGLELQQALLFFATLPEGLSLEGGLFDLDADVCLQHAGIGASLALSSGTFWSDCWLLSLTHHTSESGMFHRLVGSFPRHQHPETPLFQWLRESGIISIPSSEGRSARACLQTLVKRGLIVSDGNTYLIPSSIRSLCKFLCSQPKFLCSQPSFCVPSPTPRRLKREI